MPYNGANQVVDNQGSGKVSADEKGPEYWVKQENLLYKLLIEYRKEINVQYPKLAQDPEIARSPTLDKVARTHLANPYFGTGSTCNPHSWLATADKEAKWESCCFAIAEKDTWPCMWDKPREISGGQFQGNGYEVYHGGDPNVYTAPMTAEGCLNAFKKSTGHNPVLINNGTWSTMKWESVGCVQHRQTVRQRKTVWKPQLLRKRKTLWKPQFLRNSQSLWKPQFLRNSKTLWKPQFLRNSKTLW
ncbi:hypothetical protein ACQRIT_007120 [Beauveria bassiana]